MVNAYEIIKNENLRREIQAKGLHDFLNYDGIIFMDSGGFQAMKHGINIDIGELINVYKIAEADYYFSLDYPSPSARNSRKRILKTIENFEKLRKAVDNIIPVVHPKIERALKEYEVYREYNAEYIAIGGLVPLMLTTKGLLNGRKKAIDLIAEIRRKHNKGSLHVLGLGSPTVIPIIRALRCDSTDSASWRIKAAHGKIVLPNGGERHISKKMATFGVVPLAESEKKTIDNLNCPITKELGWKALEASFESRALFNAWVILYSNQENEKLIGPFSSLLFYAKSKSLTIYDSQN